MSEHEIDGFVGELLDRSATVASLGVGELGGFVSSLLDITEREQVTNELLGRLGDHQDRHVSAAVAQGIAALGDGAVVARAAMIADSLGVSADAIRAVGQASLTQGWLVSARFGRSLVTAWAIDDIDGIDATNTGDETEDRQHGHYGVLFELDDDGSLNDLVLLDNPFEMVAEVEEAPELDVAVLDAEAAAKRAIIAWQSGLSSGEALGPSLAANQRLVRRWLEAAGATELALFEDRGDTVDPTRGMSAEEIAEADAAALTTLQAAVGDATAAESDLAWIGCVRAAVPDLTERQRQALLWLEWADWLGVGIGLLRAGTGAPVNGEALVDLVNRCAEVSSTIERDDREYATWAFDVAVEHLTDGGLVEDGLLTERGWETLHPSLIEAWTSLDH